jgi:hypothetical protein
MQHLKCMAKNEEKGKFPSQLRMGCRLVSIRHQPSGVQDTA